MDILTSQSTLNLFYELYDNNKNKVELDLISHIVFSMLFQEENKEIMFFPKVLTLLSIKELLKLVSYFHESRIFIPNIKYLKYSLALAYRYFLSEIEGYKDIWDIKTKLFNLSLNELIPNRKSFDKDYSKISVIIEEELLSYYDTIEDKLESLPDLFNISLVIFSKLYILDNKENYYSELFYFFDKDKIIKLIKLYQGYGYYILLKIPSLNKLQYAVTVVIAYFLMFEKHKTWEEINKIFNYKIISPRKILSSIKRINTEINTKVQDIIF